MRFLHETSPIGNRARILTPAFVHYQQVMVRLFFSRSISLLLPIALLALLPFLSVSASFAGLQLLDAEADSQSDLPEAEIQHEISVPLINATSNDQDRFLGSVRGPALDSGKRQRLRLTVTNKTDRPLHFSSIVKSCSCLDITASVNAAAPGETVDFQVNYVVPRNARHGKYVTAQ